VSVRPSDLAQCLRHFPGAILELTAEGTVSDSNGRLPPRVEETVRGRALADLLEPGSREKWAAVLADTDGRPRRIELAFDDGVTYRLRAFVFLREPGPSGRLWLVEQPAELGEAPVYEELAALNSELAGAHRELARERARLERTLAAEAEARAAAETSRRALAVLEGIGELALGQRDLDLLLAGVLARLRTGLSVDAAAVLSSRTTAGPFASAPPTVCRRRGGPARFPWGRGSRAVWRPPARWWCSATWARPRSSTRSCASTSAAWPVPR